MDRYCKKSKQIGLFRIVGYYIYKFSIFEKKIYEKSVSTQVFIVDFIFAF